VDTGPGNDFRVRNGGNCLFFQLFEAIFPKFIFRVELEILLGKRRTLGMQVVLGAYPACLFWPKVVPFKGKSGTLPSFQWQKW
jgi:hypothetical protein